MGPSFPIPTYFIQNSSTFSYFMCFISNGNLKGFTDKVTKEHV
jgi:hypothetical protein